ncbi:MAG: tRNA lysidine(34) synthetase [Spirochaetota bacterium]
MTDSIRTQQRKFTDKIIRQTGKTINRFSLIGGGDTVAVGVSGGKDSLTLVDILSRRRRHLPVSYELRPVCIRIAGVNDGFDSRPLADFCRSRTGNYEEISVSCDMTTGKDPCFICSWHRRKALFEFCRTHSITTLALGHTMDDRSETLLMNLFYQGSISSMPVSLSLFDGGIRIIRPLGDISEKDINEYSRIRRLPVYKTECPHFNGQRRLKVREILSDLESSHPHVKRSIVSALDNIKTGYL